MFLSNKYLWKIKGILYGFIFVFALSLVFQFLFLPQKINAAPAPVDGNAQTKVYMGPTGTPFENYVFTYTLNVQIDPDNKVIVGKALSGGDPVYFAKLDQINDYRNQSESEWESKCRDKIGGGSNDNDPLFNATLTVRERVDRVGPDSCKDGPEGTIRYVDATTEMLAVVQSLSGSANLTDDTPSDTEVKCTDGAGVLGWIICAIGDLGDKITNQFDNVMYSLLEIPIDSWETSGAKDAWESFRTISSVLIVLVALIGIASQIFNFDFVSAYTVRKVLPKLFIAVILIQLSWFLGTMMIEISNVIGYSIQSIILTPFVNVAKEQLGNPALGEINFTDVVQLFLSNSNNDDLAVAATTSTMAVVIGISVGSAITAGPAIMLMFAGALITAGIAILVAFTIIVLRYVLILGLLIVMPLALVAWILPNTKKWFDTWWNMWFALLAMFPIVIAVLSLGKAAAIILALSAGGS